MPWQETCVRDERTHFIVDWERDEESMAELCRRYSVSRKDRLQMAAALPAAELGRFAGPLPGAATPSRSDRGRDRARDSRSAGAAQSLGCGHLEGAAAAKAARRGMAGGEHDRKSAATTRSERAPTTPAPRRTDPAAADARQAAQPGLVRRLQRLVSHPRRPALRSLNDLGRGQPLPVAVPGGDETGRGPCSAVVRGRRFESLDCRG